MGFLPPDYEAPASGNYMKLKLGENRFRILDAAITGNMFWMGNGEDRKPVRRRPHELIDADELGQDQFGKRERIRHFWAFPVWDYATEQIEILEITQRTIQDAIRGLSESSDWGDPFSYDIVIRKSGSGLDTEYAVMPGKPSATESHIIDAYNAMGLNLEALYEGGDPFAASNGSSKSAPPAATHGGNLVSTVIRSVNTKNTATGTVYLVNTDDGDFGTRDESIGARALKADGKLVDIEWEANAKGGRTIIQIQQSTVSTMMVPSGPHQPMDDDSIPF
jgi:hypothetical protein